MAMEQAAARRRNGTTQIEIVETIGILTIRMEGTIDDSWYEVSNADFEARWFGKKLFKEADRIVDQSIADGEQIDSDVAQARAYAESLAEARAFCRDHPGTMTVVRVRNDDDKLVLNISGTLSAAELESAKTNVAAYHAEARDDGHDEDERYVYGEASEDGVTLRGYTLDCDGRENCELHEIRMKTGEVRPTDSPTYGWEPVLLTVLTVLKSRTRARRRT